MTAAIKPRTGSLPKAARLDLDGPGSGPGTSRSRVPELALGALVLVVSALASLWLFTTGSERTEVLALANAVERGEPLELADLVTMEIASDDAIVVLRPEQASTMTGRVALVIPS